MGISTSRRRWLVGVVAALWVLVAVLGLLSLRLTPMTRTQEARVLVTAREMAADTGLLAWLVPRMNGELRLQKPPLAYWIAAALFEWLPDEPWLARLPFHLAGWMTVAVVAVFTGRLAGSRAGLIAGAMLAGMYLFRRLTIFAETDVAVVFFVTVAAWAMVEFTRAVASGDQISDATLSTDEGFLARCVRTGCGWAHLAGLTMALAVLSKGLQAGMPFLFLVGLALASRRPVVLWRWCRTGALLTLLLVAAPWFIFIVRNSEWNMLVHEVDVALEGGAHARPFWYYATRLPEASLPWSPLILVALVTALGRCRSDPPARTALIWLGSVLVPLSIAVQKQIHYALVALPPLAMLGGWAVDLAWREVDSRLHRTNVAILDWTLIVLGIFGLGLIGLALVPADITGEPEAARLPAALTGLLLVAAIMTSWVASRRDPIARGMAGLAAAALGIAGVLGVWVPSRRGTTVEDVAAYLHQHFPDQPVVQIGTLEPTLVFLYGGILPHYDSPGEVLQLVRANPDVVVVAHHDPDKVQPTVPGMVEIREFVVEDDAFSILVTDDSHRRANDSSP